MDVDVDEDETRECLVDVEGLDVRRLVAGVHASEYVDKLEAAARELGRGETGPLTPRLLGDGVGGATVISATSVEDAADAVRVVCGAVEWALAAKGGKTRAAFCVVRPPGHHASPNGPNAHVGGCGFCLLNSVAVAAARALASNKAKRVAVVDLDVHHGNGTQDCLAQLRMPSSDGAETNRLYASVHLMEVFHGHPEWDFFPGTGDASFTRDGLVVVNCSLTPLWEPQAPTAALAHSHGAQPGGGHAHHPHPRGREGWRAALQTRIAPALEAFQPDLLLLSVGFDGAMGDIGNTNEHEKPGLDLTPPDFEWATRLLVHDVLKGRVPVVSVLEGGYGRFAESESDGFDRSSLVACARAHVDGLMCT